MLGSPHPFWRSLVSLGSMVLLACGVYATGTRLYASLQADKATLAASDRALRFAPGNAAYWQQRAELLDEAGRSGTAALERAVKLYPGDSSIWIQIGLD